MILQVFGCWGDLGFKGLGSGFTKVPIDLCIVGVASIVEARKLEHQYPHALMIKYSGS